MRNSLRLLPLLALPFGALAADTVTINVSGTLHNPINCDLTQPAAVAFGDILSSKINGTEYATNVPITLNCSGFTPVQSVNVRITATGSTTNKIPIAGVAKGFVLALKRNNAAQNLGANIRMTANGPLNLSLTPENKAGEAYVAGAFTAAATVVVTVT